MQMLRTRSPCKKCFSLARLFQPRPALRAVPKNLDYRDTRYDCVCASLPMTPLNRFLNRSTETPKPVGFSSGKGGMKYGIEDHNLQSLIHGIPARAMISYSWQDIVAVRGGGYTSGRSTIAMEHINAIDKAGGDCAENMDQSDENVVQENQDFQTGSDDTRTDVSMDSSPEVGMFDANAASDYGVFDVLEELGIEDGMDAEEREYLKLLSRFA